MSFQSNKEKKEAVRIDDTTTPDVTYFGWAPTGMTDSEEKWCIMKMDETSGVVILWADGNDQYDNVWDDRATTVVYF
jgi:hypothetical protein